MSQGSVNIDIMGIKLMVFLNWAEVQLVIYLRFNVSLDDTNYFRPERGGNFKPLHNIPLITSNPFTKQALISWTMNF